jgi:hypothetical protein
MSASAIPEAPALSPGHRTFLRGLPTLVHGAFADSSSWNRVIERLQADGVQAL